MQAKEADTVFFIIIILFNVLENAVKKLKRQMKNKKC